MTEKVGFISLGCPKNRVDSEYMLGLLEGEGFQMERRPEEADVLLVNTCTFIEQAQRESIEAILEAAQWKEKGRCRALVVTGCLAQRYGEELRRELPEVDVILGTGGLDGLPGLVRQALARVPSTALSYPGYVPGLVPRLLSTPSHLGYLKIAEGCNNHCSFCIIPAVRGRFRSRRPEVLLEEARALAALGVKELILVAQDVTSYGRDLERSGPLARPGLKKEVKKDSAEEPFAEESAHIPVGLQREMPAASGTDLAELLQRLHELEDLKWIRLLYTYPGKINERLLTAMAGSRKVVRYLDLPLQHASRKILREMRRAGD
ncbi:MAG: radical SAM protein, partial [Firmicutes bacterium]|nr:radical SAM protein [Bacillota bacterium]